MAIGYGHKILKLLSTKVLNQDDTKCPWKNIEYRKNKRNINFFE